MGSRRTGPKRKRGGCPVSSKIGYRHLTACRHGARDFARAANRKGRLVLDIYAYRCKACEMYHLTRLPSRKGHQNELVFAAPTPQLQLWAMPPDKRDAAVELGPATPTQIALLPDPVPTPTRQPYANRPRNLRR